MTVNISTREQLNDAYIAASKISSEVLVERFITGSDYRLLVIGNQMVAAADENYPMVVGDGVKTVRELVEQVNQDPRRGSGHATSLTKIRIDIALGSLAEQHLNADSVPNKGQCYFAQ